MDRAAIKLGLLIQGGKFVESGQLLHGIRGSGRELWYPGCRKTWDISTSELLNFSSDVNGRSLYDCLVELLIVFKC